MKPSSYLTVAFCCMCLAGMSENATALAGSDQPGSTVNQDKVPITLDNFIRAATDIELDKYESLAGGLSRRGCSTAKERCNTGYV